MLRRAINGCPCVRACARLSVYSWCIVVWGNRFEGGRERESRRQTSADGWTDGLLPSVPGKRERERRTSRVFSCITSSPQTAPLLLPDITSLISRSARRNILRRGSRFSKRLPFHPSGNSFNCLERSRALLSLSLSLFAPSGISSTCSIRRPFVFPPLPFFILSVSSEPSLRLRDAVSRIVGIRTQTYAYTYTYGFSVSLSRFFFFFSVSLGTFVKGTRVKGK